MATSAGREGASGLSADLKSCMIKPRLFLQRTPRHHDRVGAFFIWVDAECHRAFSIAAQRLQSVERHTPHVRRCSRRSAAFQFAGMPAYHRSSGKRSECLPRFNTARFASLFEVDGTE